MLLKRYLLQDYYVEFRNKKSTYCVHVNVCVCVYLCTQVHNVSF